jgi:hypothetical protein
MKIVVCNLAISIENCFIVVKPGLGGVDDSTTFTTVPFTTVNVVDELARSSKL